MLLLQIGDTLNQAADTLQQALPQNSVIAAEQKVNILSLLIKGGWVMLPIALLLFLGIYIFFERYFTIRKAARYEANLTMQIKQYVLAGNLDGAIALCRNSATPIGRMLQKGLLRIGKPIKDIEGAIENQGKLEVSKLEKNISILGIIAGIAPMLGFIGTIIGVITIFYDISATGEYSIDTVSSGLYQKMITSAAGLFIGILAYIGHHILTMMVDKVILQMETDSIDFIDLLEEPTK
ncbi:outer membrane transport energization protein ExbB [Anseongella ginsenosidimutans]|uniref:Outer membrane transport energization protein ExbB n=1 Tax=Anseongella ginsenosidimutans TaxID=496056 RepID=A0A4R3KMF2_9SPHI|nr:MotA/TolQ/ExbB proton channel family protein [Anseongella ginsenosidimutans]QEC52730.1 MotA/TolQ/ExbB proton channel family protein [Anseongella ginsenosidimutans]TCS85483.1 outer membrane transport energization protein ExbB [Anseongella ginsenosidimutans]